MDSNLTKILQAMSGRHDCRNQLISLLAKKPETGKRKVLRLCQTHFIDGLRPELTTWRIKARVVSKSRIIEPNDQRQKTFFNVDLVDKSGKEIRATAFKENLHAGTFEKYYDMFQIDKTYYLSNLDVQTVSVFQKSPIKNRFELMFNDSTKIIEYEETPKVKFNFVCIEDVLQQETESFADIIGICVWTGDLIEITEHGVPEITRNITLVDTTEACIMVHLRGPEAVKFDGSRRPVVAIKNGYVTSFKDLDTGYRENRIMADCYRLNPDIYDTLNLREWEQCVGY